MTYRMAVEYSRLSEPNEARADDAELALRIATDRNAEKDPADVFLDASDMVAHLAHFCARAGLEFDEVVRHGVNGARGDLEDGPEAARDLARFPAV